MWLYIRNTEEGLEEKSNKLQDETETMIMKMKIEGKEELNIRVRIKIWVTIKENYYVWIINKQ